MTRSVVAIAFAASLGFAAPAWAESASPAQVDDVRLQIARDIVAASGGAKTYELTIKSSYEALTSTMKAAFSSNSPGDAQLAESLISYLAEEQAKLGPELLDQAATIYAERLTEAELRALLSWTQSEVAQSIQKKLPGIMQEMIQRQAPMMIKLFKGGIGRAITRACADSQCTPEQRQRVAAILEKATPGT